MTGDPQRQRAETIATQLGAGPNAHSLIKSLLQLVEADEKYVKDSPPRWRREPGPAPPAPPAVTPPATKPETPEPELTLF